MTKPIQFGYCAPIFAWPGGNLFRTPSMARLDGGAAVASAARAEALGYDSLWVADHLMLGQEQAILEGWTTLAAIAGATRRARLGIIHQAHYFRHPAVAAKMMATLDVLSGGRFIWFADTGTRGSEHHAYGLPWPTAMEARMPDLLEGIDLILKLWQAREAEPLTFDGRFYQVREAVCKPGPVQQPHPPIWFGEAHPLTLAAAARLGQGWNSAPVSLAELDRRLAGLKAACGAAGRDWTELELSHETQILIAEDAAGVRAQVRAMLALTPGENMPSGQATPKGEDFAAFVSGATEAYPRYLTEAWLVGTPDQIEAQLRAQIARGISHFMLWFMDAPSEAGLRLFAERVMPRFRGGGNG
ncbi:MAG: LLM class flavin-dependent oxidoreductase [Anaerolineales bacterium]|nr:LLM class flavin-dependent oxidoreductase [Anaerolineales bacterium]